MAPLVLPPLSPSLVKLEVDRTRGFKHGVIPVKAFLCLLSSSSPLSFSFFFFPSGEKGKYIQPRPSRFGPFPVPFFPSLLPLFSLSPFFSFLPAVRRNILRARRSHTRQLLHPVSLLLFFFFFSPPVRRKMEGVTVRKARFRILSRSPLFFSPFRFFLCEKRHRIETAEGPGAGLFFSSISLSFFFPLFFFFPARRGRVRVDRAVSFEPLLR